MLKRNEREMQSALTSCELLLHRQPFIEVIKEKQTDQTAHQLQM
jgi:hypothetical protein